MKRSIRITVLVAVFFGFYGLGAYAEETVINNDGKPVLLMDDHTWKLIDTSGDDGKVVFKIIEGVDSHASYARKDDFKKITHYDHYVGCLYRIQIENRTKYKVKIGNFDIKQTGVRGYAFYQFNKILEPGEMKSTVGGSQDKPLRNKTDLKTKEPATNSEIETLIKKYGCKAQSGKIYIDANNDGKTFVFSPESGISDAAVKSFVKISQTGVYPLREKIHW